MKYLLENNCLKLALFFFLITFHVNGQTFFRGKILEEGTKTAIEGARISVSWQGLGSISDASGGFSYIKSNEIIGKASALRIIADGYKEINLPYEEFLGMMGNRSTVYLEKIKKTGDSNELEKKNISLYWDASIVLNEKEVQKIVEDLSAFFQVRNVSNVDLIVFKDSVIRKEEIPINTGFGNALTALVSSVDLGGLSNYDIINESFAKEIVLVSNGDAVYGELNLSGAVKLNPYLIGDFYAAKPEYLIEAQKYSRGMLINEESFQVKDIVTVKGVITSTSIPISGAVISIKNSLEESYSKSDGSFEIEVSNGDIISVNALGMFSQDFLIEDQGKELSIELRPSNELLGEIVLSGKGSNDNKDDVETGFGKKSKDQLGTSINTVSGDEIGGEDLFLGDALRGRFAGVSVSGFGQDATISIRNSNQQSFGLSSIGGAPVWIVDGALFDLSLAEMNSIVSPQNIESISILKSANAATRYGAVAANGAIIIKTKLQGGSDANRRPRENTALVKGNNYVGKLSRINTQAHSQQFYEIEKQVSTSDKYKQFLVQAKKENNPLSLYIDGASYFVNKDKKLSDKIIETLIEEGKNNVRVLRTVAYFYESTAQYEKAKLVLERVLKETQKEAQSYLDVAAIYKETGDYTKSLNLYINMLNKTIYGVDFSDLTELIETELKHLVARYKDKIDFSRLPNAYLRVGYNIDLRILTSWSDRSAPFEIQFVGPSRKYFTWKHTPEDGIEILNNEQEAGYQTKEFKIEDTDSGTWLVNLAHYRDTGSYSSKLPLYLKYTLYENYASDKEQKNIKLINLSDLNSKVTLDEILVN